MTTFCGGRNDLSEYFTRNNSTSNTASKQSRSQTNATSLVNIDWNAFTDILLLYDESQMCRRSYVTGSGSIMQVVITNRTCRCILFDQLFNSNTILSLFIKLLQPILYGKIYYYPSNVHYDRIIRHINQTFESLDELLRLLRPMEINIRSAYRTLQSFCLTNFSSQVNCTILQNYRLSINLFTLVTEFLACTERNRFVAMKSESEMVSKGWNQSVTNSFFAAIEFLDHIPPNGDLPKHIRYKIRMALDYVDNTFQKEDR